MKKLLLITIAFALIAFTAKAMPNNFINGEMQIELDKTQYNAGDSLKAEITLFSAEPNPIANASVIVELVQGNDYYNPSQLSDADNIFHEEKIFGINLRALETKKISFNYTLPSELADGNYRVDAYFKTDLSNIVGIPHIFLSPKSIRFNVKGKGDWPNMKILRTKTEFNERIGPVGAPADLGSTIKGKVFIANTTKQKIENAKLFVGLCEWDDTACKGFESSKEISIDSIEAGKEKEIALELTASTMPSAYAIRIELKNADGNLVSLYRSRSVVIGATAKIRKLSINNFEFAANQEAKIKAIIGPSPDHYTFPVFKDFDVKVWIEDLEKNKTVFSDSKRIGSISTKELGGEDYPEKEFSFTTKESLSHFNLCATIEKGTVFDKRCIEFDASKFSKQETESKVKVNWQYDFAKKTLQLEFCNEPKETPLNAEYFLIEKGTSEPLTAGTLSGKDCFKKSIPTGFGAFELVLTDFNSKRQGTTEIIISEMEKYDLSAKTCAELRGKECSAVEQCSTATQTTKDKKNCCIAKCEKIVSTSVQFELPKWLTIAVILVALLLIIGLLVRKK